MVKLLPKYALTQANQPLQPFSNNEKQLSTFFKILLCSALNIWPKIPSHYKSNMQDQKYYVFAAGGTQQSIGVLFLSESYNAFKTGVKNVA